jgi:hypothetical protein
MKTNDQSASFFKLTLASSLISLFFVFVIFVTNTDYIPNGPGRRMYEVAQSILLRGEIVPTGFVEAEAFLRAKTRAEGISMWQDVFSITYDGRVFPKHSLLSSLALLPFLAVFGTAGILVLSALVQLGTVLSIHYIASLFHPTISWVSSFIGIFLGTQLLFFGGGVPYDSLGALLVVGGVAIARKHPLAAGLLVGLSVFSRPTNVVYVLVPLFFTERCSVPRIIIGAAIPVCAFLMMNSVLWGSPFTTAHHRMTVYEFGEAVFNGRSVTFKWELLASDWAEKLFSLQCGLLLFNPLMLCIPLAGKKLITDPRKAAIVSICAIQMILVFSYDGWRASFGGNRYLCPALWLLAPIALGVLDEQRLRLVGPRTAPHCQSGAGPVP